MAKSNKPVVSASKPYPVSNKPHEKMEVQEPDVLFDKVVGSNKLSGKNAGPHTSMGVHKSGFRRRVTSVIAENEDKPEWKMTPVEKMEMYREGISKQKLEALKRRANLDYDKLSTLLSTTRATLINKKGSEPFGPALSERIVSIADVYSYGYEVFEDEAKFNEWVNRPNRALGGKPPFDLLDNQFGREEVKNIIGRIEYGVYS